MELTKQEIDAKAASDPSFAAMLAIRDDNGMAAALSIGRTKLVENMLTERGVMSTLGIIDGEAALVSLETFAASTPTDPALLAVHPGIKRMLAWLKTTGINVGDPLTRSMLDLMESSGILTQTSTASLKMLAVAPDPVTSDQVSEAIDNG
jgi:hypothetical protein